MGNRWGYPRTHRARVLVNVSASFRLLLSPRETLRLLTAVGVVGTILALPANALISPTAAVGATPGSFAVSPSGAATYTIPIIVPPGVNGMQPSLALVYNSQAGNGLLGMGWGLAGLSVIHRCGATIEIDGFKGGVNYDAADRLCLDGERLIGIGGNEYRTERESLQKVLASDPTANPVWLTVTSPDGTVREYAVPIEAAGNTAIRRLWALSKVKDKFGNYYTISYDKTNVQSDGDYHPVSIAYTANDNAGTPLYNSVALVYGSRTDIASHYEGGYIVRTLKLLTSIASYAGTTKVREYQLGYQFDGEPEGAGTRARLKSIQECGTDGACLPATQVSWLNGNTGFPINFRGPGYSDAHGWNDPAQYSSLQYPDLNGDGKADLCALDGTGIGCWIGVGSEFTQSFRGPGFVYSSGWNLPEHYSTIQYPDLNGDGKTDLCARDAEGIVCWIGTGFGFVQSFRGPNYSNTYGWNAPEHYSTIQYPDLNGDGRADLCARDSVGLSCYIGTGSGFVQNFRGPGFSNPSWMADEHYSTIQYPDLNGDGKADLCARTGSGIVCWIGNGLGFDHDFLGPNFSNADGWNAEEHYSTIRYPDLNGDGRADLCARDSVGLSCYIGTGSGFVQNFRGPGFSNPSWMAEQHYATIQYPDLNGDGKADLCARPGIGIACWIGTGSGFVGDFLGPNFSSDGGWSAHEYYSTIRYIDLDGDGKSDLVARDSSGLTLYPSPYGRADAIVSIMNGLGASTAMTYKPLTNTLVYTKDTDLAHVWGYPYQEVQAPLYVVSQASTTNGNGGLNTMTYQYGGLKTHHIAGQSLGFRWIQTTDAAGLINITYHNQIRDAGTEGTVAIAQTFANGVRVKQVVNSWINSSPNSTCTLRLQPQLASSTEETRDLNNTVVTTVTTTNTYDGCGYPTQTVTDLGGGHKKTTVNQYTHDTTNWRLGLVTRTDVTSESPGQMPQTRVAGFGYDTVGRLTTEVIEPDQPALSLTTAYGYDTFGNRVSKTVSGPDIETRSESQTFDARGQFVVAKTNTLGHTSTFDYDARNGQPTRITDANGLVTTMDYDGFGRKGIETRPDGVTTRITYAATSSGYSIQTQTDGAGDVYTFFDILGRPIRSSTQAFGGNWIYQDTTYDALGRVTQKTHPYFAGEAIHVTSYGYDILGRVTDITDAGTGNRTTSTVYDGLKTTVTNPLNQSKTMVKDVQGRTVSVTDAAGPVQYQYDPVGNLTQVTGVDNAVISMQYDGRSRKIAMQDPDMGSWTYGYNVLGELKWQRDGIGQTTGQVTTMTYDKLGRLLTKVTPEATSTWSYDTAALGSTGRVALGKLANATKSDDNYSEAYTYDRFGRTKTSTINASDTHTVTYDYDAYGRTEYLTYPDTAFKVRNRYDASGYLYQVARAKADGTESLLWQASAADAHARITQEMFGNGLVGSRVYNHETGDLETIQTGTAASPASIQNLSYTFDALDNLVTRTDAVHGLTETFDYDNLNRLTRATATGSTSVSKTYAYSANGNLTSKSDVGTYTYGGPRPHAVTQTQGIVNATYEYDANGNMTSGAGRSITYTAFNKPKTVIGTNGTTTFYYDVNDNRFQKSTATKDITYVGKLYERVTTSSLTEHKHYVYGGKNLVATYTERNNGTPAETRYVHTDHLDSVNVITDENGNVTERLSFDPHGKRRNPDGSDATTTITSSINRGYTRHEHDDEVGLINMNARLYDPIIGRFITPDTIIPGAGNSQAYNRYTYVKNNPLSLTDPTGHWSLKKHVKAMVRAAFRPSLKNLSAAVNSLPGAQNKYVRTIGMAIIAYYTFGAASGAVQASMESAAQACFASMPVQAAMAGGAAAGAATGAGNAFMNGGSGSDILRAGFKGGVAGGIAGGASSYTQNWNTFGHLTAKATAGGVGAEIQGGDFRTGFIYSSATATASWGYQQMVGRAANPLPGENRPEQTTYRFDPATGQQYPQDWSMNVVGTNEQLVGNFWADLGKQGSALSIFFNSIPGINATGGLHDYWFNAPNHLNFTFVNNVGTMLPAAAISYAALLDGPLSVQLAASRRQ